MDVHRLVCILLSLSILTGHYLHPGQDALRGATETLHMRNSSLLLVLFLSRQTRNDLRSPCVTGPSFQNWKQYATCWVMGFWCQHYGVEQLSSRAARHCVAFLTRPGACREQHAPANELMCYSMSRMFTIPVLTRVQTKGQSSQDRNAGDASIPPRSVDASAQCVEYERLPASWCLEN